VPGAPDPTPPSPGPLLVGVGALLVVVGILFWTGALSWFGKLPGDIRYEGASTRIYVPWVSMLLVSAVLSLVTYLFRRFH